MKLKTLAIAIMAATAPLMAQADVTISGDIGVGYMVSRGDKTDATKLSTKSFGEWGSEINFDASDKVGGITYMGHMELDINSIGGNDLRMDEVRVGAKGGFGEIWGGDVDNGCNQLDISADQTWWTGQNGAGCKGAGNAGITYKRSMGPATVSVSHNPNSANKHSAIGVSGNIGKFGLSLGYEDGILGGTDGSNIVLGLKAGFGPVTLYADWNKLDPSAAGAADVDNWGANLYYSGRVNAYIGAGENGNVSYTEVGVGKTVGKTDFILEISDNDNARETGILLGARHRF